MIEQTSGDYGRGYDAGWSDQGVTTQKLVNKLMAKCEQWKTAAIRTQHRCDDLSAELRQMPPTTAEARSLVAAAEEQTRQARAAEVTARNAAIKWELEANKLREQLEIMRDGSAGFFRRKSPR